MARDAVVGVDVGTTFIKAVVFDPDLAVLGDGMVRTPWRVTPTGTTADPRKLADAAVDAVGRALRDARDAGAVRALSVTGMGETGVFVDARGEPLAPAIAWHDPSGQEQAVALERDLSDFAVIAGRRPTDRASVVKWRLMVDRGVDLSRAARWYSVAEWVVAVFGARPQSDLSLASRTGAVDVRGARSYDDALRWAGGSADWFGELVPSGTPAGPVTHGPSQLIGAVAMVAGLDGYASVLGVDEMGPAVAILSCGTSGAAMREVVGVPTDDSMCRAAAMDLTVDRSLDGRGLVLLGATPCGLILQPMRDVLGAPPSVLPSAPASSAGGVWPPGDNPPSGELWRRAYEAVADGQARLVRDLERLGPPVERVVAVGGWIADPGLRGALERRLPGRLQVRADATTAALGAARLARRLLG